jgi:AraC family transcriptional regulator
MPVQRLPAGSFFGQPHGQQEVAGIVVLESGYRAEQRIPRHEHAAAFFDLIVAGACHENVSRRTRYRDRSSLAFHPAGEVHSSHWHGPAPRCFHIEIPSALADRVRQFFPIAEQPRHFRGGTPNQVAARLHLEFQRMDDLSLMVIEGLTLELLAEASRPESIDARQRPPGWLHKVQELMRTRFADGLSLQAIADSVGVHPSHLSRVFRRFYGCTVGEYVRGLRIDFACRCLTTSQAPLAQIALAAGFVDQSHFSNAFRRQMGRSPTQFRRLFAPRKLDARECSDYPRLARVSDPKLD